MKLNRGSPHHPTRFPLPNLGLRGVVLWDALHVVVVPASRLVLLWDDALVVDVIVTIVGVLVVRLAEH